MEAFGKQYGILPGIIGATHGGSRTHQFLAFHAMPNFSLSAWHVLLQVVEYLQKETISGYLAIKSQHKI